MKALQYFSEEALERSRRLSPDQVVRWLEEFRGLHAGKAPPPSVAISLRMPAALLEALKQRARREGIPYQTLLKRMLERELERP